MTELTERLDAFENRLRLMEEDLQALRRLARLERTDRQSEPEAPVWEMLEPDPAPQPAPHRGPTPVPVYRPETRKAREPRKPREPIDLSIFQRMALESHA